MRWHVGLPVWVSVYLRILWPVVDLCLEVFLVVRVNTVTPLSLNFHPWLGIKANGFFLLYAH